MATDPPAWEANFELRCNPRCARWRTEEKFAALLAKQVPDEEKRRRADFIVDSSRSFDYARAKVYDILKAVAKMPRKP